MKRLLCVVWVVGALLFWNQTASAERVGESVIQTESFQKSVSNATAFENQLRQMQESIRENEREILRIRSSFGYPDVEALGDDVWWLFALAIISLLSMTAYTVYLIRWNPKKWKMMTSPDTLPLLWKKLLLRNGRLGVLACLALAGLAASALVLAPSPALAGTNVLQDMAMHFSENEYERMYVRCKYADEPIVLPYLFVNEVPVIRQQQTRFDRNANMLAHLLGLKLPVTVKEMMVLHQVADNNKQYAQAYALLAHLPPDRLQEAAMEITNSLGTIPGGSFANAMHRMTLLLKALPATEAGQLKPALIQHFLRKVMGQIRNLESLALLVDFAAAQGVFDVIKEQTIKAMQALPSRLPHVETVHAASITLHYDTAQARTLFNSIRYNLMDLIRHKALEAETVALMRVLAEAPGAPPLFEAEALQHAMQPLSNFHRIALGTMLGRANPALAAMVYPAIASSPQDFTFATIEPLAAYVMLTLQAKPDNAAAVRELLTRIAVETPTDYTRQALADLFVILNGKTEEYFEQVLRHDMATDCKFNYNTKLLLSIIDAVPAERLSQFEDYFFKKTRLRDDVLEMLFTKNRPVFNALLRRVFEESPAVVERMVFPNDILDFSLVAPAFSQDSLQAFTKLRGPIFVAQTALASPTPDLTVVRKSCVPILDNLFTAYLTRSPSQLTEEEALTVLGMLALLDKPTAPQMATEVRILAQMADTFFQQHEKDADMAFRHAAAMQQARARLQASEMELHKAREVAGSLYLLHAYVGVVVLYVLIMFFLSLVYGCNAILPGYNFSLLQFALHQSECVLKAFSATVVGLLFAIPSLLVVQFLRALTDRGTTTPDLKTCHAVLRHGLSPRPAPGAAAEGAPPCTA